MQSDVLSAEDIQVLLSDLKVNEPWYYPLFLWWMSTGLRNDEIVIRSTGCPNGCGHPYLGEIGLVGKVPGKYNLYLGAGFDGERLNKLYRASITHAQIIEELKPILISYAKEREEGERFGDFTIRKDYVKATTAGNNFHANIA